MEQYQLESEKKFLVTILLCFFLGVLGAHRFYVGKIKTGVLQLVTLGGFGIWAIIDLIMIIVGIFTDKNGNYISMNSQADKPAESDSNLPKAEVDKIDKFKNITPKTDLGSTSRIATKNKYFEDLKKREPSSYPVTDHSKFMPQKKYTEEE